MRRLELGHDRYPMLAQDISKEINMTTPANPEFSHNDFTATKFNSAEDKAKFANHLIKFIQNDFPERMFYKWFYERLSNCFGHIAHYNICGFYEKWFRTTSDKIDFLYNILDHPCYGHAEYTYSDVEKAIKSWLSMTDYLQKLKNRLKDEDEKHERYVYETLKAKYEDS